MDATCNVQDSIHVFHLVHNMCPGFWVHIKMGSKALLSSIIFFTKSDLKIFGGFYIHCAIVSIEKIEWLFSTHLVKRFFDQVEYRLLTDRI